MDKTDLAPAVLGVGAIGMIGVGLYLWTKEPGVKPGAEMLAVFNYQYNGEASSYYFQVMLGHIRAGIFDEVEGLKWRVLDNIADYPDWSLLITNLEFKLPEMMDAGKYDAEASIRTLLDDKLIVRVLQESAVVIPK